MKQIVVAVQVEPQEQPGGKRPSEIQQEASAQHRPLPHNVRPISSFSFCFSASASHARSGRTHNYTRLCSARAERNNSVCIAQPRGRLSQATDALRPEVAWEHSLNFEGAEEHHRQSHHPRHLPHPPQAEAEVAEAEAIT